MNNATRFTVNITSVNLQMITASGEYTYHLNFALGSGSNHVNLSRFKDGIGTTYWSI